VKLVKKVARFCALNCIPVKHLWKEVIYHWESRLPWLFGHSKESGIQMGVSISIGLVYVHMVDSSHRAKTIGIYML